MGVAEGSNNDGGDDDEVNTGGNKTGASTPGYRRDGGECCSSGVAGGSSQAATQLCDRYCPKLWDRRLRKARRTRDPPRTPALHLFLHACLLTRAEDGQDVNQTQQFRGQNLSFTAAKKDDDEPEI